LSYHARVHCLASRAAGDEAARAVGAAALVTRNGRDFARAVMPVFSPEELLEAVTAAG